MNFETEFKDALEETIPLHHDDYIEMQYSDEIYVQVWSHDDGAGAFEIDVIIPHDEVDASIVNRDESQLPPEVPGVDQFYTDVERLLEDVTGETYSEIVFYLTEVVDDGTWERDATVYSSHKLTSR